MIALDKKKKLTAQTKGVPSRFTDGSVVGYN
jgi:hypothetical protein